MIVIMIRDYEYDEELLRPGGEVGCCDYDQIVAMMLITIPRARRLRGASCPSEGV